MPRKRQRLSSPTYDDQFTLSQEEINSFDELDRKLSQRPLFRSSSRGLPSEKDLHLSDELEVPGLGNLGGHWGRMSDDTQNSSSQCGDESALTRQVDTDDDFFAAGPSSKPDSVSASYLKSTSGFTTAAKLPAGEHSGPPLASGSTIAAPRISVEGHKEMATPTTAFSGFSRASALPVTTEAWTDGDSSQPEPPPVNYDAWFDPDSSAFPANEPVSFTTARGVLEASQGSEPPSTGFMSASNWKKAASTGGDPADSTNPSSASQAPLLLDFSKASSGKQVILAPSAAALAAAQRKMESWNKDDERISSGGSENTSQESSFKVPARFQTPLRPALRAVENSYSPSQPPDTPSPPGTSGRGLSSGFMQNKNKPFKSPMIGAAGPMRGPTGTPAYVASPLNPTAGRMPFRTPLAAPVFSAPSSSSAPAEGTPAMSTPAKARTLGMTPRRVGQSPAYKKPTFTTPFKAGSIPGERGSVHLGKLPAVNTHNAGAVAVATGSRLVASPRTPAKSVRVKKTYQHFNLSSRSDRRTLDSSGLRPQTHTEEELFDMGINVEQLSKMTPALAIYYFFDVPESMHGEYPPGTQLGAQAAYERLRKLGCSLATLEWVENHWGLVLWKLAGMVCLEPQREQDPANRRWCWNEVVRQLLYRYERELAGGSRPALRLISADDAPASCPMVLCVSGISWGPATVDSKGTPLDPHPELEVTDGWYKLRAHIDLPLARAVRRGLIKVGRKLAVSGAKLSNGRKEPCEILEAYDSTTLELTGNSTHLAPWHAKLGFQKDPYVATLDSLTADGGVVAAVDLTIVKAYPIAFLEFVRNEDGSTAKVGPRDEREELKAHDQWMAKREAAMSKLREDHEKRLAVLFDAAEKLRAIAGPRFQSHYARDDSQPTHIDGLYSQMMEDCERPSDMFKSLTWLDAGYLSVLVEQEHAKASERLRDEIERDLDDLHPPRQVRDFRVVVVRDARWHRKEPMRTAQVTVWEPMRLIHSEGGKPGEMTEGQRFLVTNLMPNQPSAWMAPGPESVVYLVSRKNTRWTQLKRLSNA